MPDFAYVARNAQGVKVTGMISAASEREAAAMIVGQSLFPVNVSVSRSATAFLQSKKVRGQIMAVVYAQMAALLRSGVPLLRALAVLRVAELAPAQLEPNVVEQVVGQVFVAHEALRELA